MFRLFSVLVIAIIISASCTDRSNKAVDSESLLFNPEESEICFGLPDAPRWIDDSENLFSKAERDTINKICEQIFSQTGYMAMIHTVSSFGAYQGLNQYTKALDIAWADAGQKYFIFIISASLEELRIIHGELTENKLHNNFADFVMQKDIFPEFKAGNYSKGILSALYSYREALKK